MTHQTVHQRRPRALSALGWLLIVQGVVALAIFGALLAVLLAVQTGAFVVNLAELSAPADRNPILLSAGAGLIGIFSLVSGVGLLRLHAWAWLLALITQGVLLLVALIDYWLGNPDYVTLALGVVQVYLLNRPDVQQAVRPAGPHTVEALPGLPVGAPEPPDVA